MRTERLKISASVTALAALVYIGGGLRAVAAVLLPVTVHELGHIAALHMLGLHIKSISVELKGLRIDYYGRTSCTGHVLAAAAGPVGGILFALFCSWLGGATESSWLNLTAGVSVLLSAFNLLPALPLDGGRIILYLLMEACGEVRGELVCRVIGSITGLLLLGFGLVLTVHDYGPAALAAGIYILLYQTDDSGLVKKPELS